MVRLGDTQTAWAPPDSTRQAHVNFVSKPELTDLMIVPPPSYGAPFSEHPHVMTALTGREVENVYREVCVSWRWPLPNWVLPPLGSSQPMYPRAIRPVNIQVILHSKPGRQPSSPEDCARLTFFRGELDFKDLVPSHLVSVYSDIAWLYVLINLHGRYVELAEQSKPVVKAWLRVIHERGEGVLDVLRHTAIAPLLVGGNPAVVEWLRKSQTLTSG